MKYLKANLCRFGKDLKAAINYNSAHANDPDNPTTGTGIAALEEFDVDGPDPEEVDS